MKNLIISLNILIGCAAPCAAMQSPANAQNVHVALAFVNAYAKVRASNQSRPPHAERQERERKVRHDNSDSDSSQDERDPRRPQRALLTLDTAPLRKAGRTTRKTVDHVTRTIEASIAREHNQIKQDMTAATAKLTNAIQAADQRLQEHAQAANAQMQQNARAVNQAVEAKLDKTNNIVKSIGKLLLQTGICTASMCSAMGAVFIACRHKDYTAAGTLGALSALGFGAAYKIQ